MSTGSNNPFGLIAPQYVLLSVNGCVVAAPATDNRHLISQGVRGVRHQTSHSPGFPPETYEPVFVSWPPRATGKSAWVTGLLCEVDRAMRPGTAAAFPEHGSDNECCSPGIDWETCLSQVMERLIAALQPDPRNTLPALRLVSKAFAKAASASVSELTASSISTPHAVGAIHNTFTRAQSLVIRSCVGGICPQISTLTSLRRLDLSPLDLGWRSMNQLQHVGKLRNLEYLTLWGPSGMTSHGLGHLSGLVNLKALSLGQRLQLEGRDMHILTSLTSMASLQLVGCRNMCDAGLRSLGELKNLREIEIGVHLGTLPAIITVGRLGLEAIALLPALKRFDFVGCDSLKTDDLEGLTASTSLETLSLGRCRGMDDGGFLSLAEIPTLTDVSVMNCRSISDAAIESLMRLTRLQSLKLGDCWGVTDATAHYLRRMVSLRKVVFQRCPLITDDGLDALASIPHIRSFKLDGIWKITMDAVKEVSERRGTVVDWRVWDCQVVKMETSTASV